MIDAIPVDGNIGAGTTDGGQMILEGFLKLGSSCRVVTLSMSNPVVLDFRVVVKVVVCRTIQLRWRNFTSMAFDC